MEKKNNIVVIKDLDYETVKSDFKDYFKMYEQNFQNGTTFILYSSNDATVIQAPENIDDDNFFFLANYMGLLDAEKSYYFRAYYKAKELSKIKGKRLNLYMDMDKTKYDDVFVVTEDNEHYQVDMGFNFKRISDSITFSETPTFESLVERDRYVGKDYVEPVPEEEKRKKWDNRYFNFAYAVLGFGNVYGHLYGLNSTALIFASITLVGWWFFDYKLLQNQLNYNKAFFVSALFLCSVLLIPIREAGVHPEMKYWLMILPLVFLAVQYPARKVFIKRFKREPKVEKPARSIEDFFYTISLLGFTALFTRLLYLFMMIFGRS